MDPADALDVFSPATRAWFQGAFKGPTAAQAGAWRAVDAGQHTLVIAPTGSGKTLAAFLWALDRLATEPRPEDPRHRCQVLYVSPLKALAVDVERNLRAPLVGIRQAARRLGLPEPVIEAGVRTGDTPADQRRAFARRPPDVLVTTPESLFLLLTSSARESLRGVRTVILDEVHAVAGGKRGAHLALSLERLDALLGTPAQRIGLSATVRPVEEVTSFLAGGRPVTVVNPPTPKTIEVRVEVPVADMAALGETRPPAPDAELDPTPDRRPSIWPAVEQRVYELVQAHRSTIVFANSRRLAERLTARLNEIDLERIELHDPGEDLPPLQVVGDPGRTVEVARPDGASAALEGRPVFPAAAIGQSGIAAAAPAVLAKAHHGSMSREQRTMVEEQLKAGQLSCVVATSSLELGIDMGAVDLVVQVESPPSVASGMQRIGRAGHQVGVVSRGVVFPKFRGDLISSAVVAERMAVGALEAVRYPRNPLDVLAQQIVAMVAMDRWSVSELATLIRRAAPFAGLPDSALHTTLDMLAGRYPSDEFGELRPRVVWDRVTGELTGRPGAQRLAVTSGGTIPDRGLFTVMTPGGQDGGAGSRVGELDEEMVYESRVGDTFLLGTSAWRVQDITHDRVIAVPAPGQPARMPFWKGDSPGRPLELGRAIGAFVREVSTMDTPAARERLTAGGLDEWAIDNLLSYVDEQRQATRHLPDDRTILVERFRDELGDWRLIVHSPFGAPVNGPWALAIAARMRERRGVEVSATGADDGIVLRLPDAVDEHGEEVVPTVDDVLLEPDEIERVVVSELANSALFAARFRECAARALLLPRRDPRRRTPLWQQRQRASQLLTVAAKYEQFPIVLEAMRECLRDVYDMAGLREIMSDIAARRTRVVEIATPAPSPFARALLFGYIGMFLYEGDAPLAERRAAALSLDTALLAELLGAEAVRELLDPDVLAELENSLQRRTPERVAKSVEDTADLLRLLGDLTIEEAADRGVQAAWLRELVTARRAIEVRLAGESRFLAVEDAGRVRDALGTALPVGVPEAFTEPVADPLGDLLSRYARTHGPFTASAAAHRFGLGVAVVTAVLERMTAGGRLVKGELRPVSEAQGRHLEYCDADVLRRLRRASLAKLRAEVEPVEPAALGRFLPAWHGVSRRLRTAPTSEDVLSVVEQLAGAPLPASAVESLILPARLPGYSPALLDELTSTGEVTWTGCGGLAGGDGWIALAPTEIADLLLPDVTADPPATPVHQAVLSALDGGALFFRQLADRTGAHLLDAEERTPDDGTLVTALWDLVWAGLITNDTLAPLRAVVSGRGAHRPRAAAPRGRYATLRARPARPTMPTRSGPPTVAGRWSLVADRESDPTRRAHARAEAFLERHGVLTRGALDTEQVTGGFAGVYRVLRAMEDSGRVVRGYVVDGLGAAQFAVRGAVDRLRATSRTAVTDPNAPLTAAVLAAADPAQPYGAALPWPEVLGDTRHRPGRKAGALAVLVDGVPVLYVERGGRSLLTFTDNDENLRTAATALAQAVRDGWLGQLAVARADGEHALSSHLAAVLTDAGFRATPKGLRLRA